MIDYAFVEFVDGSWPLPKIVMDHEHVCYSGCYIPTTNEIHIAPSSFTFDFVVVLLSHEMAHWGQFAGIPPADQALWADVLMSDSSIFHDLYGMLELNATWSTDADVPYHMLQQADHRRARRIVKHRDGRRSWRRIPLLEPLSPEEWQICVRLGAVGVIVSIPRDNVEGGFYVAYPPRTDPELDMYNFSVLDRGARIEEKQARINFETSRTDHGRSRSSRFFSIYFSNDLGGDVPNSRGQT